MYPAENCASSFGDGEASIFARNVPRVSSFGVAHSGRILILSVSRRFWSKFGILRMPVSCSYSPLVKNRTTGVPPEICAPDVRRYPVVSGDVFGSSNKLNLVRLSDRQTPEEIWVSGGFKQLRVLPVGAWPHSVYAVGQVFRSRRMPLSPKTRYCVAPARP